MNGAIESTAATVAIRGNGRICILGVAQIWLVSRARLREMLGNNISPEGLPSGYHKQAMVNGYRKADNFANQQETVAFTQHALTDTKEQWSAKLDEFCAKANRMETVSIDCMSSDARLILILGD